MPRKRKLALSIMQENEETADAIGVFPCIYDKSKIILKSTNIGMNPWKQVTDQLDFIESIVLSLVLCKL